MASGDHYEILDFQELQGQLVLNVYVYQASGGEVTAANVATVFHDEVMVHMLDMQNVHITHTHLQVLNLDDLTDFADVTINQAGTVTGDSLPPYDAFGIRFIRTSRAVRHAHKRIAGVSESDQTQGVLTAGAFSNLNAIAGFIAGPVISTDLEVSMIFKIWRRPTDVTLSAYFDIGGFICNSNVTTQVSRKIGRGV